MKALIVGGGIGGLTTYLALRAAGLHPVIFEQAPALREAGAGITLWSNATRILDALGLLPAIQTAGATLERGEVRDSTGQVLASLPLGDLGRKLSAPIVGIHRADLLNILARQVNPDDVHLEARVLDFRRDGEDVIVHTADERLERGGLLVGADGIQSRIRELLLSDPPRYCGAVGWRGVLSFDAPELPPGVAIGSHGRGGQFGIIPVGGGRVYWFASAAVPEEQAENLGEPREELLARFRDWHRPIPQLLEAIDSDEVLRSPLYDRPPAESWGSGRVTLLGDAAHATTPMRGQGACLALESAVVLGDCLRQGPNVEAALRRYEAQRMARTAPLIRKAWRMGRQIHWSNSLGCWLRDQFIRRMPEGWKLGSLERDMTAGFVDLGWLKQAASRQETADNATFPGATP